MVKGCPCTGCKYSRGEVSGDEYFKWVENCVEEAKVKQKTEEDEDIRAALQCDIDEGNELLTEYLKSKEE
jgi:coenzyme F420-reducing hydrogenase delta subunit